MRKKDITLIIVVVFISAVISFLLSGYIVGNPETEPQSAEKVEDITTDFNEPSTSYYNNEAINPTQLIRIGDEEGNQSPFRQSDQ
ncbi:hypothetical protein BH23PAT2_BH23PAT2_03130 [soil metagenome]